MKSTHITVPIHGHHATQVHWTKKKIDAIMGQHVVSYWQKNLSKPETIYYLIIVFY